LLLSEVLLIRGAFVSDGVSLMVKVSIYVNREVNARPLLYKVPLGTL